MDGATPQTQIGLLMESGQLCLAEAAAPLSVRRGMRLLANDGSFVGFVAAVVTTVDLTQVTHLLVTRRCPHPQYQMAPVAWIAEVSGLQIQLKVAAAVVDALPPWHSRA
jgi:hypothetical protein